MMHIRENWWQILDIHHVFCIARKDSPFQLQCLCRSSLVYSRENPYPTTLETTDYNQCNVTDSMLASKKWTNVKTYLPSLQWSL